MSKTASTSASRMQKMRERLKYENPDFQKQENKRIAQLRKLKKQCMTEAEVDKLRKYERDRKRLQRAKKRCDKLSQQSPSGSSQGSMSPYQRRQSLGKAVWRTTRALPKSPRKKIAVLQCLAERAGLSQSAKEVHHSIAESKVDYSKVRDFYFRPDIVYTCPGINDCVTIWDSGIKKKLQKHYLTMFLKEAFSIFKEGNPDFIIGFSKFCSLRPKNVLLLKNTPCDQCKCKVHENFIFKLKALKYTYSNSFWEKILCDVKINSTCWQNKCEVCCNGKLLLVPENNDDTVVWKCWEISDEVLKCSTKECQVGGLFEATIQDLPSFKAHVNLKRIQSAAFENDKLETSGIRILQIDLAMSFSCEYQNEIMSALWSRESVLLFTAASFFKGKCQTFVVCSDTKNKDKNTIFTFIDFLYSNIFSSEQTDEKASEEVIWSDGPASEFKNRYMAKVLSLLSQKYDRKFSWKYFATSHGKGVVDGVGGNVKRLVREKVMSQGDNAPVVQSTKDFADLAAKIVTNTKIFYIDEQFINRKIDKEKPWIDVLPIPGISSFHIMKSDGLAIYCKTNALSSGYVTFRADAGTTHLPRLAINQWAIVNYHGDQYRGEITEVYHDTVKVNVMHESMVPGFFKWPKERDEIAYSRDDIVKTISGPVIANNRGLYKFTDN